MGDKIEKMCISCFNKENCQISQKQFCDFKYWQPAEVKAAPESRWDLSTLNEIEKRLGEVIVEKNTEELYHVDIDDIYKIITAMKEGK